MYLLCDLEKSISLGKDLEKDSECFFSVFKECLQIKTVKTEGLISGTKFQHSCLRRIRVAVVRPSGVAFSPVSFFFLNKD